MLVLTDVQQELSCREKSKKGSQGQRSENPTAQLPRGKIYLCSAHLSPREIHIKVEGFINLTQTLNSFRQLDVHLLEKMKLNCQVFKEEISVVHLTRQVAHLQNALQATDVKVILDKFPWITPLAIISMSARWRPRVDMNHRRAGMWESCSD